MHSGNIINYLIDVQFISKKIKIGTGYNLVGCSADNSIFLLSFWLCKSPWLKIIKYTLKLHKKKLMENGIPFQSRIFPFIFFSFRVRRRKTDQTKYFLWNIHKYIFETIKLSRKFFGWCGRVWSGSNIIENGNV